VAPTAQPTAADAAADLVQVRVWLPVPVADWLGGQAALRYESRSQFIRHLIVALYLYTVRPD
jgi:hypothetical protein